MTEVAARDLRNDTAGVLRRVEAGEHVVITVHGRPVAQIIPVESRRRPIGRTDFLSRLTSHQADPALRDDLRELVGELTDENQVNP